MNYFRPANERGQADFGWLDSKHSFSFGSYYDANHMGVSALRVINDDLMSPSKGFDTHGHQNMEIISYVLDGSVQHKDSMGHEYVVPAGDVQLMSAGSGVMHSEFNHSAKDPVHFLQIWIAPNVTETEPGYQQARFDAGSGLTALVTPNGRDGSLVIRQNASMYRLSLDEGQTIALPEGNAGYLHMITGELAVAGEVLSDADGIGFDEQTLKAGASVVANKPVHALYFALP